MTTALTPDELAWLREHQRKEPYAVLDAEGTGRLLATIEARDATIAELRQRATTAEDAEAILDLRCEERVRSVTHDFAATFATMENELAALREVVEAARASVDDRRAEHHAPRCDIHNAILCSCWVMRMDEAIARYDALRAK